MIFRSFFRKNHYANLKRIYQERKEKPEKPVADNKIAN